MFVIRSLWKHFWPPVRRVAVLIVGAVVLMTGVALLVLPGPAFVVIPVGLAILAIEFEWARRWLRTLRESAVKATEKLRTRTSRPNSDQSRSSRVTS